MNANRVGSTSSLFRRRGLWAALIGAVASTTLIVPAPIAQAGEEPAPPDPTEAPTTTTPPTTTESPTTTVPVTTTPPTEPPTTPPAVTTVPDTTPTTTAPTATTTPATSVPEESTTTTSTTVPPAVVGVGQSPVSVNGVVWSEGFESGQPTAPRPLSQYIAGDGSSYGSAGESLASCAGVVMGYADEQPVDAACDWASLRTVADALGQWAGGGGPGNHALSAPAGLSTQTAIAVEPGHYYSVAVDAAFAGCAGTSLDVSLGGTSVFSSPVNVCAAANVTAGNLSLITAVGDSPVLIEGDTADLSLSVNGANGAIDNVRLIDVTPRLDVALDPTEAATGAPVTLTMTVTNSDDLLAKDGWAFTATLPEGLTVAPDTEATTTCGEGAIVAEAGSNTIAGSGDLAADAETCELTAVVTASAAGDYALGADAFSDVAGLTIGDAAAVTVTEAAAPPVAEAPSVGLFAIAANSMHEIRAGWAAGTPLSVPYGDVVTAEFRVNTNDASDPPGNNDATNVTVVLTSTGGVFDSIPVVCDTVGVTPVSSISPDGITLTCNLGTIVEGNSTIIRAPVRATALDGGPLQVTGTVDSDTSPGGPVGPVQNAPLPITYTNGMDLQLEEAPGQGIQGREIEGFDGTERREIIMNFSLSLLDGSTPGPATYSFPFTVARTDGGGPTVVRFEGGIDGVNDCVPIAAQTRSAQQPFSDPLQPDRTNFPTCTITGSGSNYTLTVSGLDYSFANVPANDSFGTPLPQDRTYIASASVRFSVPGTIGGASYEFSAPAAPNFIFAQGAPPSYVDNKANNTSSLTITAPGGFSNAWYGSIAATRNAWDDNLWLNQGAGQASQGDIYHQANNRFWESYTGPGGLIAGTCTMHSSTNFVADYVDFGAWTTGVGYNTQPIDSARLYYTTGPINTLTHTCGSGNWIEIPVPAGYLAGNPNIPGNAFAVPANAVGLRVLWDPTEVYEGYLFLRMFGSISPTAPVGSEIWTSSAYTHPNDPGVWYNRSDDPAVQNLTATPWSNYVNNHPGTNGYRDVMRIQGYMGVITKVAESGSAVPGQPVTYNLTAEAQTTTQSPPPTTITVSDALPIGMEYIAGSGSPTPTVSGVPATGQTLTFTIPSATPNTEYPITYQAQIPPDVAMAPDTRLTNVATITVPGDSRPVASRQARDTITVPSQAATQFLKTVVDPRLNFYGDTSAWTLTITSSDPAPSEFTDTIDMLPYAGDPRGTNVSGTPPYTVTSVDAPAGSTVYYTTADPLTINPDPRDATNGTLGGPVNPIWSTTAVPNPTAIRVIGPELAPGGVQTIAINFTTPPGTECLEPVAGENRPDEVLVNSATAVAEETGLQMRSSAQTMIGGCVDFDKEIGSLNRNADGTYTVDYTLTATGLGDVLPYDLVDTLMYGDAITVNGQPTATFLPQDPAQTPVPVLNTWDAATSTLTVAQDVPIADGETQVFGVSVNVSVDGATVTWENTNCEIEGAEEGTGLLNEATLTNPDVTIPDETCPEVPYVEHEKTVTSGPTPNGDGTYTVEYLLEVRNLGAGADEYDLRDQFLFGEAVTIEGTPTVTNVMPGGIATLGTWDPTTTTLAVVADEPIDGSTAEGPTIHHYAVTVVVSVDAETVTFENTDCEMGGDESGTGLFNESTLGVDEHETTDDECLPISEPVHVKTVSAGPTPNGDGTYTVEYTIAVENRGAADSVYDLVDDFEFGSSVTIEGTPTVANTVPGDIATLGTWDPAATTLDIVAAEPILAGTPEAAEMHEYVVTVVVSVDAETLTFADSDCAMGEGESGTGLFNTADLIVYGGETERDACVPISEPFHHKDVTSGPTPVGNGNYEIVYTITVENHGDMASDYDLADELLYGERIEVVTAEVANTTPGGIDVNAGWDGLDDLEVVADVPIDAGTPEAPATHTYTVTVVAFVPIDIVAAPTDCVLGAGETGTGFLNVSTLTHNGEPDDDDACVPAFDPTIVKDLVSVQGLGGSEYAVTYQITVEAPAGEGIYDLNDTFRFSPAITPGSITTTGPEGVSLNSAFNGRTDTLLADEAAIGDGETHVYTVTVNITVAEAQRTPANADCTFAPGEAGTGLRNEATITVNDQTLSDDACGEIPPPPAPPAPVTPGPVPVTG